jgi:hypothetical protein
MDAVALLLTLGVCAGIAALWAGAGRRAALRMGVPRRLARREVGLGDLIKWLTTRCGLEPCTSCQERALALNQRVRFAPLGGAPSPRPAGARVLMARRSGGLPGSLRALSGAAGSELQGTRLAATIFPPEAPSAQISGFDTFCRFGVLLCRGWTLSPDAGKVYNRRVSICGFCGGVWGASSHNMQTERCNDKNKKKQRRSNYPYVTTPVAPVLAGGLVIALVVGGVTGVNPGRTPSQTHSNRGPGGTSSVARQASLVTRENSVDLAYLTYATVSVSCQAGETMVSGGYRYDATGPDATRNTAQVISSYPSAPDTWSVRAVGLSGYPTLTAQVVCLRANFPVDVALVSAAASSPPLTGTGSVPFAATAQCAPGAIALGGGEQLTPDGMAVPQVAPQIYRPGGRASSSGSLFSAVPIAAEPVSGGWSVTEETEEPGAVAPPGLPTLGGQFTLTAFALCAGTGLRVAEEPAEAVTAPAPAQPPGQLFPVPQAETLTGQIGCQAGELPVGGGFRDATAEADGIQTSTNLYEWDLISQSAWTFGYGITTTLAEDVIVEVVCITS